MKADKDRRGSIELPEEVRGLIQAEIESGLKRFRSGPFGARLRAGLPEKPLRTRRVSPPPFRLWAPVAAGAAALVLVAAAILWFGRSPHVSGPTALISALGELPGFQAMGRATPDQLGTAPSAPAALSPFLRPLAAAAEDSSREPGVEAPAKVEPRYTLQQKLSILIKEQPIERALKSIKTNLGEV